MAIEDILENALLSKIFKNTFGAVSELSFRKHKNRHPQMALCAENVNYSTKAETAWFCKISPDNFHMASFWLDWFWLLKFFGLLTSIRIFYNRKSTHLSYKKVFFFFKLRNPLVLTPLGQSSKFCLKYFGPNYHIYVEINVHG